MPDDFMSFLGFKAQDLVAGFAGGFMASIVMKKSNPWEVIGSVVVGGFTANYLSGPIGNMIGTSAGASAFIVGLVGMAICQGIIESAKSWAPFKGLKPHE